MKSKILENIKDSHVMVIGDIMLDTYYEGDAERISPEAPVPVVKVERTRYILGGAGNVARNVTALGGKACIISVIGNDFAGEKINNLLHESNVKAELIKSAQRQSTVKSRIFARNQQMIRFDEEVSYPISQEEQNHLFSKICQNFEKNSVIILSDYGKGVLYKNLLQSIFNYTNEKGYKKPLVLIDPKPVNKAYYENAYLITPNTKESESLSHANLNTKEEIISAGKKLREELKLDNLVITLGGQGMAVFYNDEIYHIKSTAKQVFDVTGAGDTVIATLAASLSIQENLKEAAILATLAAGIVVEKVGSATASTDELSHALQHTEIFCEKWV